jgi:predicted ATPase
MRATLDWSYELLSEPSAGCSGAYRYCGGLSLEAAEAVGASEEPEEVLGMLAALVEQSWSWCQCSRPGARCAMSCYAG